MVFSGLSHGRQHILFSDSFGLQFIKLIAELGPIPYYSHYYSRPNLIFIDFLIDQCSLTAQDSCNSR